MVQRQRNRRLASAETSHPRLRPQEGAATLGRPSCRLEVILADESPRAVIFRRGPPHQVRQILWDRNTDSFAPGQWLANKRVYLEKSALSPNGEYLLAFVNPLSRSGKSFTLLSRPPFFTALALWPWGTTFKGGGVFTAPYEIELDQYHVLHAGYDPRAFATTGPFLATEEARGGPYRAARRFACWRGLDKERQRKATRGFELVADPAKHYGSAASYAIVVAGAEVALVGAQWADVDANGDLLFAIGGALHRCRAGDVAAAPVAVMTRSRLLADFTDMRYEHVLAPYRRGMLSGADEALGLDGVSREDRRRRRAERDLARRAEAWKGVIGL